MIPFTNNNINNNNNNNNVSINKVRIYLILI